MRKTLFNASFEQSQNINPNLFSSEKPSLYSVELYESMKFLPRIGIIMIILPASIGMYSVFVEFSAGAMTNELSEEGLQYISQDIIREMGRFVFLKPIILFILFLLLLLAVVNFLPKKNYMVQRMFGVTNLMLLFLVSIFGFMPFPLGTALGATGWLGFTLICVWGVGLWGTVLQAKILQIRRALYGSSEGKQRTFVGKVWHKSPIQCLCIFLVVPFGFVALNIFWWQIGLGSTPTNFNYAWMFAGPGYFVYFALFMWFFLKMFISSFYFAKYAEQYRVLWKVTDEAWYGKRKARKMQRRAEKRKK